MNLSPPEIRVLGCLLEKQRTTPDVYPLSLNSLRLACNQSTNRDPVVQYDDAVLRDALHRLERRGYTRLASGAGSRAAKYRHLLAEALPMGDDEQTVLTVLMLRGPQTPGELKQRGERMHAFADLAAVHDTLSRLIARALVAELERRPGQKEERYTQLLGRDTEEPVGIATGAVALPSSAVAGPGPAGGGPLNGSGDPSAGPSPVGALTALEERVARLERQVAELHAALGGAPEAGPPAPHAAPVPPVGQLDEGEEEETGETLEWT
jgi:uncharacterized protein